MSTGGDAVRRFAGMGQRIKDRREQMKLTQAQLAERVGASQPTVNEWENERKTPSVRLLVNLASVLDCCTDWLLFGRSCPQPDGQQLPPEIADVVEIMQQLRYQERGMVLDIARLLRLRYGERV